MYTSSIPPVRACFSERRRDVKAFLLQIVLMVASNASLWISKTLK